MLDIKLSGLTLKEKATLYSILISYRNKKLKFNTEQQNKYNSFYEKLCETVYPQNERPGTVKNNFYHYFVKHPEENMDKLPFKNPFINFNSYPNVIHLEEPETMIKFPDDELSEESITIYSRKSFDGWKKDGDFYTNKIPYVDNYKKEPEEFFNYIYNMVTK